MSSSSGDRAQPARGVGFYHAGVPDSACTAPPPDAASDSGQELVSLNRSAEPWVGRFPGLGWIEVHVDGDFRVHPEPSDLPDEARSRGRALTFGWAEPLSWARRGYVCAAGTALVDPASGRSVFTIGSGSHAQHVVASLATDGWLVVADALVPLSLEEGHWIATPRHSPLIGPQGRMAGIAAACVPARADTDAFTAEPVRVHAPTRVDAILQVLGFTQGDLPGVTPLRGIDKAGVVAAIPLSGAWAPAEPKPAEQAMAELQSMLRLPAGRLCQGVPGQDVTAEVETWLREAAGE